MSTEPPPDDSSSAHWAKRGRVWTYLIHGLLVAVGILYAIDVIRHYDRLDAWLSAGGFEGPLARIVVISLPALLVGVVYWRVWKGFR